MESFRILAARITAALAAGALMLSMCGCDSSDGESSSKAKKSKSKTKKETTVTVSGGDEPEITAFVTEKPEKELSPEEEAYLAYADVVKKAEENYGRLYFLDTDMVIPFGVEYIGLFDIDGEGSEEMILKYSDYGHPENNKIELWGMKDGEAECIFSGEPFSDNVDIIPLRIWKSKKDGHVYIQSGQGMSESWDMVTVKNGRAAKKPVSRDEWFNKNNHDSTSLDLSGEQFDEIDYSYLYSCMPETDKIEYIKEHLKAAKEKLGLDTEELDPDAPLTAERAAEIVANYQYKWLAPYENMGGNPGEDPCCWFQDMDLDGTPEFIIGGFNMQTQGGIGFSVYKIRGDKLIKQLPEYITNTESYETERIPSVFSLIRPELKTDEHGFGMTGAEVVRTRDCDRILVLPIIYSFIDEGYGLSFPSFNDDKVYDTLIGAYAYTPGERETYAFGRNSNCSKEEMKKVVDAYLKEATVCEVKVGTIPCTKGAEWINKDNKGTHLTGCYDLLTRPQKIKALTASYLSYSIKDSKEGSTLYQKYLNSIP